MEKLSLDKFYDKKLENIKVITGGELYNTTYSDSDGGSGTDVGSPETGEIVCDDGLISRR